MRKTIDLLCLVCMVLAMMSGCKGSDRRAETGGAGENLMKHAEMIRMEDGRGFTVAEIVSPSDSAAVLARYILVDKDSIVPDDLPEGTLLRIPLDRLTVFSTIYTDALTELGAKDRISGVVDAQYITTPEILEGLRNGTVADCGSSMSPVAERIIATRSDGIIYCQYEGMDVKGIDRLGVPLITMVDNYETDPLGRAEWILFLGALSGQRDEAQKIFDGIASRYQAIKQETASSPRRPKIMTDNLYQGVWYVPGGRSYQARLIADAGGDYVFASDTSAGTLSKSLEEMISGTQEADIWIMRTIKPITTLNALKAEDNRYSYFRPFRNRMVYAADGSRSDVFSVSAFHPDVMLREYATVFGTLTEKEGGAGEQGSRTEARNGAEISPKYYQKLQ